MEDPRVKPIEALANTADRLVERAEESREQAARTLKPLLETLTNDALQDLADGCGEEKGASHCIRCMAWAVLVERGVE